MAKKNSKQGTAPQKPKTVQKPTGARKPASRAAQEPSDAEPIDSRSDQLGPPVAGVGASAGGLDAFKKFFTAMPADSGIAFVLIPHLDPKHESLMVELLARHTSMPVVEAADGMAALANHVYIIPPNKYMTIAGGVLRLTGPIERGGPQTSIDLFLRSLAQENQERAITREDLQSTIEELQSANEELETSEEERLSLNEELNTVNNQLHEKVQDLEAATNDMANLLGCTHIATLFLDSNSRIKRFTPAATRLFNLIADDIGRPLGDIVRKFSDDQLLRDAQHLLRDLMSREKEVQTEDGRWYVRRIIRDITRRRELEREVVEIASLEQRRIADDLHDSVAQELTALSLVAKNLAEVVRSDPAEAAQLIGRMTEGLQRSQQSLRDVLRGLLPVAVDSEGLMTALADLADHTRQNGDVSCTFECPKPVVVADNVSATHLFLIAQEAVHNALRHAKARKIRISLRAQRGLVLSVQDDGIGLASPLNEHRGLGLRIMRNRAAILGAQLTIAPGRRGGTLITCILAKKLQ